MWVPWVNSPRPATIQSGLFAEFVQFFGSTKLPGVFGPIQHWHYIGECMLWYFTRWNAALTFASSSYSELCYEDAQSTWRSWMFRIIISARKRVKRFPHRSSSSSPARWVWSTWTSPPASCPWRLWRTSCSAWPATSRQLGCTWTWAATRWVPKVHTSSSRASTASAFCRVSISAIIVGDAMAPTVHRIAYYQFFFQIWTRSWPLC